MYRPLVDHNVENGKSRFKKNKFYAKTSYIQLYWFKEGRNDEEAWEFIAKIKYGKNDYRFIYYGSMLLCWFLIMKFYISKDIDRLIKYEVEIPTIT